MSIVADARFSLPIIIFFAGVIHVWILILQNTRGVAKRVRKMEETEQFQPPYELPWYRKPGLLFLLYLLVAGTVFFTGIFRFPTLLD